MDAATLAKTAEVSALAEELMRVDEPAPEVKAESAAEAWSGACHGVERWLQRGRQPDLTGHWGGRFAEKQRQISDKRWQATRLSMLFLPIFAT